MLPIAKHDLFEFVLEHVTMEDVAALLLARWAVREKGGLPKSGEPACLSDLLLTLPDLEVMTALLGRRLATEMVALGNDGLYVLSFAIRYRVSQLNLFFHLRHEEPTVQESAFFRVFSHARHYANVWVSDNQPIAALPLFSSLGVHLIPMDNRNVCAFVDPYERIRCPGQVESGSFCQDHGDEAWWCFPDEGSRSAKMLWFFSQMEHINLWSTDELDRIVEKFWQNLPRMHDLSQDNLQRACARFGLSQDFPRVPVDPKTLRQTYLRLAFLHHPDAGGAHDDFLTLQQDYRLLVRVASAS